MRKKKAPIPREHGAWVLLYGPVLVVLLAFGGLNSKALLLLLALTGFFLAHEPLAKLVRVYRRGAAAANIRFWKKWLALYSLVAAVPSALLVGLYDLWLLLPLGTIISILLLAHLYFISARKDRSLAAELLGMGGLTASGPLTYYVGTGQIDSMAAIIWTTCLLFFASGILYVKLRIARWKGKPEARRLAASSIFYHAALAAVLGWAVLRGWIPPILMLAFLPVIIRAFWPILFQTPPELNLKKVGYTEVAYTCLFVLLLGAALQIA